MYKVEHVAAYIAKRYRDQYKQDIESATLHKLLYFAQRECIILHKTTLFDSPIYAGEYGPTILKIIELCGQNSIKDILSFYIEIEQYQDVFEKIMAVYSKRSITSLIDLSKDEISWKNAMDKKRSPKCGHYLISNLDIEKDARKIEIRKAKLLSVK